MSRDSDEARSAMKAPIAEILLAGPRGFCAGVERAIDIVELALSVCKPPVYVRREIVHNRLVVETLRQQGAIFVDELDEVPDDATVIFSAHGISPEVRTEGARRRLRVIDATCPLVTKVHLEAIRYAREDYSIVLIGHEDHDEVIGTRGASASPPAPRHPRCWSRRRSKRCAGRASRCAKCTWSRRTCGSRCRRSSRTWPRSAG